VNDFTVVPAIISMLVFCINGGLRRSEDPDAPHEPSELGMSIGSGQFVERLSLHRRTWNTTKLAVAIADGSFARDACAQKSDATSSLRGYIE
jgi:hypothetical protein